MNNIISTSKQGKNKEIIDNGQLSQTESDLNSLISSNNSVMRTLAVRNLKYYPEHLDLLLAQLAIELDEPVIVEIKKSLFTLASNEPQKLHIETSLKKLSNESGGSDLLVRTSDEVLAQLRQLDH